MKLKPQGGEKKKKERKVFSKYFAKVVLVLSPWVCKMTYYSTFPQDLGVHISVRQQ